MLSHIKRWEGIRLAKKSLSSLDYASLLHELTLNKWIESVLQGDWQRARITARKLSESGEKFWSWLGYFNMAVSQLCQGRAKGALQSLTAATNAYADATHLVASTQIMSSHVLIEMGRPGEAVEPARKAMSLARESPLEVDAIFFFGQAQLRQGRVEEALQIAEHSLKQVEANHPYGGQARYHQLRGEMMIRQGELDAGVQVLEKSCAQLDERKPSYSLGSNQKVHVRFLLASAYLQAKRTNLTTRELEDIVRDTRVLLSWPVPYVRSFFLLGMEYMRQGELSKAQKNFQRFLHHWKDGELDPDQVKEAARFLAGSAP
jgi:tetratricopeptide (TPR) repeat protein